MPDDEMPGPGNLNGLDLVLSRHASGRVRDQLDASARRGLTTAGSASVTAVAIVGDLRLSSLLLREAVAPSLYARFVVAFTEAVRALAGDYDGWFDKFTGDGFLTFWLYSDARPLPTEALSDFCLSVLSASGHLVANLRRNSRNFPVGVGLGLGLDAGPCELIRIGDAITVVGSPVVGATRMASGARAGEAILNVHLGDLVSRDARPLEARGMALERTVVKTKEYPEGQEAFRLDLARSGRLPSAVV